MALDTFTLSGTSLNDETNFVLESLDLTPPKRKPEWAQAVDSDGADLIRTPKYENRTITATIRIAPQSTKDLALAKLGTLVDLLQEAEQNPEGIPLVWSPASSTKTITFYVLTAEVMSIPMVNEGSSAGWYASAPQIVVQFTCKPFGYGPEVEAAAAKSIETGLSIVTITLPTVTGDVPAEGRLVVKDTAAVGRRYVEWGLQNRYYDAATALVLDNESMTPVAGTQSEALNGSGSYKPGPGTKGTLVTTLFPSTTICANTGVLKHVGTFRVKARVCVVFGEVGGELAGTNLRLSYQDGEGPLRANPWVEPPVGNLFTEVDLGAITLTPAILGTQKWFGQIEAYSTGPALQQVLHIDYLTFIPMGEGYGKARGARSSAPGAIVAFDNFTTGTLFGNLNGRTPAVGVAWATSGAATDFTVATYATKRVTTSDASVRFGVFGSAVGNARVSCRMTSTMVSAAKVISGVVLRWVDGSNYVVARVLRTGGGSTAELAIKVAGVETLLAKKTGPAIAETSIFDATLDCLLDGSISAVFTVGGTKIALGSVHAAVKTGGALASGKGGIIDQSTNATASTREYGETWVSTLPAVPYCVQASRTMEVHSDSTIAQDSTGTYYGPVPQYRGSRFHVPQTGSPSRTSRILVKADRNDLEESDQQTIADAFTAQAFCTPRYVAIPRV